MSDDLNRGPQTPKEKPGWLQSSVDPTKVSLTIKGLIVFVPAIISLATFFGVQDLTPESVTEAINQTAVVGGALATLWGLTRKYFVSKSE
jgi:hypothetical protein